MSYFSTLPKFIYLSSIRRDLCSHLCKKIDYHQSPWYIWSLSEIYFILISLPPICLSFTWINPFLLVRLDIQLKEYGYSDKFGPEGNIPSGPLGSGNVIITLLLVIVMSAIWLEKLMTHETGKANDIGIDEDDLWFTKT